MFSKFFEISAPFYSWIGRWPSLRNKGSPSRGSLKQKDSTSWRPVQASIFLRSATRRWPNMSRKFEMRWKIHCDVCVAWIHLSPLRCKSTSVWCKHFRWRDLEKFHLLQYFGFSLLLQHLCGIWAATHIFSTKKSKNDFLAQIFCPHSIMTHFSARPVAI